MTEPKLIPERDFYETLKRLRDVREWAWRTKIDPFAFRQAIITVLELDTTSAIERGVNPEKLEAFDAQAREETRAFIGRLPR